MLSYTGAGQKWHAAYFLKLNFIKSKFILKVILVIKWASEKAKQWK